jgi:hypothetical protein
MAETDRPIEPGSVSRWNDLLDLPACCTLMPPVARWLPAATHHFFAPIALRSQGSEVGCCDAALTVDEVTWREIALTVAQKRMAAAEAVTMQL